MSDSDLENDFNYLRNTRPGKINGLGHYTTELLNDVETKMEHAANTQANLDQIDELKHENKQHSKNNQRRTAEFVRVAASASGFVLGQSGSLFGQRVQLD